MLIALGGLVLGLVLLTWSADKFIDGAAAVAQLLGMSPLLVGILIVGFGTSAPEMLVSAIAAWQGEPDLALGNAIGSNIANVGLILGLTALMAPIAIHSTVVKQEIPLLLLATGIGVVVLLNGFLGRGDAVLLLGALATYIAFGIWQSVQSPGDALAADSDAAISHEQSPAKAGVALGFGLLVLLASSRLLVWSATEIATGLGVSELIIGLTIVALGTSLPELAASIASVRKNQHDLAVGNVIGSNVFNILGVVGIAGLIHPDLVSAIVVQRDSVVMVLLTIALAVLCWRGARRGGINRWQGALLVGAYVAYNATLAWSVVA
ncbi:calcium/sodium antiporter [Simiduia agarivorans]|uniref:CcaA n=1 Tax=Simiduia agarivorans (strain DSM 21679 / JCM 13881 / BCRC 17597 / SA1) TaxID=1117647 RepID=K4KMI5_SIMAS|nr:calcium/sodium antiporter [Simiduia agarivorans]AFU99440.1 CcaA [Simiduia agarivorans SA1 = DSM 21679]